MRVTREIPTHWQMPGNAQMLNRQTVVADYSYQHCPLGDYDESCLQQTASGTSTNSTTDSQASNLSPDMKVYKEVIRYESAPLSELLSWKATSQDMFNIAVTPLAKRYPPIDSKRPKTLVCHDMMGGYLEDRFIQGADSKDPYVFYHWQYIDIFVYFSHRMFTLPPVCWTNTAHQHGVSVLGTFITEWEDGAKTCESFLAGDESTYKAVADQMVALARFYRFDGWLINIENVLSPVAVSRMPLFLSYLTEKLHSEVPGGLVLWYDSVIHTGELKWQNELNDDNR
ncbi:unnamed protein product [Ranitomeya imitator]|uniref:Cytosolic endo-beta-N-acetylglucosaminidase TIM barrel domain-containing protein n=1 Tax=Ranitomeya imitator TaxID=111125 RepID=A0ABN9MFI0_9NEOB|nr:unnamed protein product [Ranitomeya imitator]